MGKEYTERLKEIYGCLGRELTERFLESVEERSLVDWFYKPNEIFDKKTPIKLASEGQEGIEKLERICYALRSGIPN